ncbi:hypothetical protein [Streptomyces sediminimaris]|uniref:hypothetical protein n=1 Tax=Streptomyces sediminimaris TaxID=3383721 RepID=UPI00399B5771
MKTVVTGATRPVRGATGSSAITTVLRRRRTKELDLRGRVTCLQAEPKNALFRCPRAPAFSTVADLRPYLAAAR